jgi:hypothetical protein
MQVRLALFVSALLAVFSLGAAAAFASGDEAVLNTSAFRLNPHTLEPSCFRADYVSDVDSHLIFDNGVTEEGHVTVQNGASVSIDQLLVPGSHSGYTVYNVFQDGYGDDPSIDPNQTAHGLRAPGDFVDNHDIIACVSQHDGDENQPYEQAANGEVAATNRPKLRPTIASIGLSPIGDLHTFKIGLGYATDAWYSNPNDLFDPLFPASLTDPQLLPFPSNNASFVEVDARADQPGVRRVNDIDVSGEQYSPFDADTADHGQVQVFRKAGDPYSFCVAPDNCGGSLGVGHLLAFDAQGDLPISWTVKASLAPESYKRTVTFDFDDFVAWYRSWQDYYNGGPKPTMPLAPGTNPPARDPNLTVLNNVAVTAGQAPGTTTSTVTTIIQQSGSAGTARSTSGAVAAKAAKSSIRSAKVIRTKTGKRLVVFVKSNEAKARIQIRMYGADGRKVGSVNKTVATNRSVKVNARLAAKAKTVKVVLLG